MTAPIIVQFPVVVPVGFQPADPEKDGPDFTWDRKPCPCQAAPYRPAWGGGFRAGRVREGKRLDHRAIDIMGAQGLEIRSIGPGTVVRTWRPGPGRTAPGAGWSDKGGYFVLVEDPSGWRWYYAHLMGVPLVLPGDGVQPGALLGYLGRTGNAIKRRADGTHYGCPHLHLALTGTKPQLLSWARGAGLDTQGDKVDSVPLLKPRYNAGEWRGR